VFILATTEAHKLPETIISRTQRHIFRPVDQQKVIEHLKSIAEAEKLQIDDDALALFAAHGEGSFRDSISLLDQASGIGKVTADIAQTMLGMPPDTAITKLLSAVAEGNSSTVISQLNQLTTQGYQATAIAKRLGEAVRAQFLAQTGDLQPVQQLALMRGLIPVPAAADPTRMLEIVLFEVMPHTPVATAPASQLLTPPVPKPSSAKTQTPKETTKPPKQSEPEPVTTIIEEPGSPEAVEFSGDPLDPTIWPQILDELKKQYNTLYGIMRMAVPEFSDNKLTLRFRFAFHQKRMNEAKHRQIIVDVFKKLTGQVPQIECIHDTAAVLTTEPVAPTGPATPVNIPSASLSTISNIFGGGELLES
jgi:DNA polymerase-3 subunit gamma/tau